MNNRIYKFRAWDKEDIEVRTGSKGSYKQGGYIMQKAPYHPHANKRGYVPEHRLIIENHIGRYLVPRKEFVHHINQIRDDNRIENLQLQGSQNQHAKEHDTGKRNSHGQFLCKEPIFNKIKFRLLNKNTGLTTIYTLNKLISTTFRNGQFEFRGRFTGLKDKNGVEVYAGDILDITSTNTSNSIMPSKCKVVYGAGGFDVSRKSYGETISHRIGEIPNGNNEVIGNVWENPELYEETK